MLQYVKKLKCLMLGDLRVQFDCSLEGKPYADCACSRQIMFTSINTSSPLILQRVTIFKGICTFFDNFLFLPHCKQPQNIHKINICFQIIFTFENYFWIHRMMSSIINYFINFLYLNDINNVN